MKSVTELISDAENSLEPFPATAARLTQLVASDKAGIDEIAAIIRYDEAVTMEVLRYANSAESASRQRIADVRCALIRTGAGRLLQLLSARFLRASAKRELVAYGYNENDLWRHSIAASAAAECLVKHMQGQVGGLVFAACLLHDIGKLVLTRTATPQTACAITQIVAETGVSWEAAERRLFGFSHADVGAGLCRRWNLPDELADAVGLHHGKGDNGVLVDCVRVANVAARVVGEGLGFEGLTISLDEGCAVRLGLTKSAFEQVCAQTVDRFTQVTSLFE